MGQEKCKTGYDWSHLHIPTAVVWGILISLAGYMINLNTRVAVLESSNIQIEQKITDMAMKIDKIYDKIAFNK